MISWDDSFSSGMEEIDNQHHDLIRLLQRLAILRDNGSPKDFVLRIPQEPIHDSRIGAP